MRIPKWYKAMVQIMLYLVITVAAWALLFSWLMRNFG